MGVEIGQRLVERGQSLGLEQFVARNAQLATQVEQLVLDVDQQFTHCRRQLFAQQQAELGIEFVHITHGMHAQAVFRDPGVVAQSGAAVVAGAGCDLCQTFAHGLLAPLSGQAAGASNWCRGRVTVSVVLLSASLVLMVMLPPWAVASRRAE